MKVKLKKGLDLSLAGGLAADAPVEAVAATTFAIVPDDFPGFVPKLEVKEGDSVKAGEPLLRDKNREQVKIVAPMAGTVKQIVRGERRKIERVVLEAAPAASASFDTKADDAAKAVALLCASGMLARMRQRPYDIVPNPDAVPRDIFVTAIDSAPLSAGFEREIKGNLEHISRGAALLAMVTTGKVYISVPEGSEITSVPKAEVVVFEGKHPVGNAGVQAANIKPVNKGETIWTLDIVTLIKIGKLLATGTVDGTAHVAVTGSEVSNPYVALTTEGAAIEPLLANRLALKGQHLRIISGNVLTGTAVSPDSFLRFPYRQITVIPEGDDVDEFMGWASLSPAKMSVSRSFPGHFLHKLFKPDARVLGGERAMIMSGEYDRMIPMDILPEYLIKAILAKDIESMEKLGIYEVAPEDFALAEYADTSKLPLQKIVREGLDYLRKELE